MARTPRPGYLCAGAAVFLDRLVPGLVGSQSGGTVKMGLVVVVDFDLEELVGLLEVLDFLVGQERHQAPLESAEKSFDFAFGLRRGGDAVVDAQSGECALELGQRIQAVLSGGVTKEAQAIGVKAGWATVCFEGRAQETKMAPGRVGSEAAGDDFAGVVIRR